MFDELLEVGHNEKDSPGRITNAPLEEPWNLQLGQFQKSLYTNPKMSYGRLTSYSLAPGEYISIHSKPWIISTTKEKEVTTLQRTEVRSAPLIHFQKIFLKQELPTTEKI